MTEHFNTLQQKLDLKERGGRIGKIRKQKSEQTGASTPNLQLTVEQAGFPGGSAGKTSVCNAGDPGLIPGLGRSPGEGNGSPLQYSCLENLMDSRAW